MSDCEYCGRQHLKDENCGPDAKGYCKCCGITYTEPINEDTLSTAENTENV